MAEAKRKPLVAGNWKMNGSKASARELKAMIKAAAKAPAYGCELMICPPATLLAGFVEIVKGSALKLGGQDCHAKPSGAHTGDVSAEMLKEAGAKAVIVGHSERRQDHGETDAQVQAKALAVRRAGLQAIICIGETLAERDAGKTLDVVKRQLQGSVPEGAVSANTVIAYEPVWAIGTGRTARGSDAAEMAAAIRGALGSMGFANAGEDIPILYGGSVTSSSIDEFMAEPAIDGALVGGASLKPDEMAAIVARAGMTAQARAAAARA
jgi:triosephosphate isomerase